MVWNRRSRSSDVYLSTLVFKIAYTIICFTYFSSTLHPFAKIFEEDCIYTLNFYQRHLDKFKRAAKKVNTNPEVLFSIVAPEVSQNNNLRNRVEIESLLVLYVQGGSSYANFSIGYFQMKPSFAEMLEKKVKDHPFLLENFSNLLIQENTEEAERATRIDRLCSLDWQIEYLSVFYYLAAEKYHFHDSTYSNEDIMNLAACYNVGLDRSIDDIQRIGEMAQFPRFSWSKFKYKEVALFFYDASVQ